MVVRWRALSIGAFLFGDFLIASSAMSQVFYSLAPLAGSTESTAQCISPDGKIVVGYSSAGSNDRPTIWTLSNGTYTPAAFPSLGTLTLGAANSINASGAIVGYGLPSNQNSSQAITWTNSGGGYVASGLLPAAQAYGAYSINSAGGIAGFGSDGTLNAQAYFWADGTSGFLPVPANTSESAATTIDDDGDIAGYAITNAGLTGVVWLHTGPATYTQKSVIAIDTAAITSMNIYGTGAGVYAGNQPLVSVYFEGDFYGTNLPMPFGATDGASDSVNSNDVLVGYVKDPTTSTLGAEAAIWLPTDTEWNYVNLDQWLNTHDPNDGSKWVIEEATSINDNGLAVGYGTVTGSGTNHRAFVLDASSLIPEPACLGVATIFGALFSRRRRRSIRL